MKAKKTTPQSITPPELVVEDAGSVGNGRRWYIALLLLGLILLGVSTVVAYSGTMNFLEQRVFSIVNGAVAPNWVTEQLAKPISNAVWGMVGLVVVLLAFPKFRLRAWQYAVAGGAAYVMAFVIEHVVDRARPAGLPYEAVLRAVQDGPGFPSGHVAVLTALGLTLWVYVTWPWRILMLMLIVAEAWSRVFLGVHAPLDVVGGFAVGAIVVAIIHLAPSKIRKFFRIGA